MELRLAQNPCVPGVFPLRVLSKMFHLKPSSPPVLSLLHYNLMERAGSLCKHSNNTEKLAIEVTTYYPFLEHYQVCRSSQLFFLDNNREGCW
jgi:hypothetical protein